MAVSYLARVNQKLAFARISLQEVERIAADSRNAKLRTQAMLEGGCFHLFAAYHAYLKEVGESYHAADVEGIDSLQGLITRLANDGKTPAETKELQVLFETDGSWLQCLASAYQLSFQAQSTIEPSQAGLASRAATPLLALAPEGDNRCTLANLKAWLQELTDLINRHRESMVEC